MTAPLVVAISGQIAGTLAQHRTGRLELTYENGYVEAPSATPLSVSLPLRERVHSGRAVQSWLANLLPDNPRVLDRWAGQFQVSASNPFALLRHVGRDVAGAVQFVPENAVDSLLIGGVVPLSEQALVRRIDEVIADPAAWTPLAGAGQFSLPGAQPKLALRLDPSGWGKPWGNEATTHILKPPMVGFGHQELNEHLSLVLARYAGLPAAHSRVLQVGPHRVVCVSRYDRTRDGDTVTRIHQEDLCQALGVPPTRKYQADGGPGAVDVIGLLNRVLPPAEAADQVGSFLRALAFAWVTVGTDAHAKNYSLLLAGREIALAPLYDLNSALPCRDGQLRFSRPGRITGQPATLAMSIGGKGRLDEITGRDWARLASQAGLDPETVASAVADVVELIAPGVEAVVNAELDQGGCNDERVGFARTFQTRIQQRAAQCQLLLRNRTPRHRYR